MEVERQAGWHRDFLAYFLVPWLASTLLFELLIWWRNPPRFDSNWSVGIVASSVFAFVAFLGYAAKRRRISTGAWRELL